MKRILLLICLMLVSTIVSAKIEVLSSGTLYLDDASAYGKLDGTDWYAVTSAPTKIKKVKISATPDSDNQIAAALSISGGDGGEMFFVRGFDIKATSIESQNNISVSEEPTELAGGCSIYYTSRKTKSKRPSEDSNLTDTREYLVKCNKKTYKIESYILEPSDLRPSIVWAGDLNGDGVPEFKIHFDPWEKSAAPTIYFSEKTKDGYKYQRVNLQYQSC